MTIRHESTISKKVMGNVSDIKSYSDLVNFFNMNLVLCNEIVNQFGHEMELITGDLYEYYNDEYEEITEEEWEEGDFDTEPEPIEFYQYYIIDSNSVDDLEYWTDETIFYVPSLDVYVWAIGHLGTSWDYVNISLKESAIEDLNNRYNG